jgi:hypothetical protein
MGNEMIELQPNRLKGRVLVGVPRSPAQSLWERLPDQHPRLGSNEGNATEAAMKTIPVHQCSQIALARHPHLDSLLFCDKGQRVLDREWRLTPRPAFSPE